MGPRKIIAVQVSRERVRAMWAVHKSSGAQIKSTLDVEIPQDIASDDPRQLGKWIAHAFKQSGFPGGGLGSHGGARLIIAIRREEVGLKHLTLPTIDDSELASMTRLAMQRDLPFEEDGAVIDFVPVQRGENSTTVLAVAASQKSVDFSKSWARAAGYGIERITLSSMGLAALVRLADDEADKPAAGGASSYCFAIDISSPGESKGGGLEFCAIDEAGCIRSSRAAAWPGDVRDELAAAEAVVTETRRTWMSFQSQTDNRSSGGGALERIIISGPRRIAEYAGGAIAQMLKPAHGAKALSGHPLLDLNGQNIDDLWLLAGLIIEPFKQDSVGQQMLNFAQPRQPANPATAGRRRLAMAATLALVVAVLLYSLAARDLRLLREQARELAGIQSDLAPKHQRALRDEFRLTHLQQWDSVQTPWLEHARYLASLAPTTDQVVLDSWHGSLDFRGVTYSRGKWSVSPELTIVLDGEARDRQTADSLRELLTRNPTYRIFTTGTEAKGGKRLPFGFTYTLRSQQIRPPESTQQTKADADLQVNAADLPERES